MCVEEEYYLSGFPETKLHPVGRPDIFSVPAFCLRLLILVEPECSVAQKIEPVRPEENRVESGILVQRAGLAVAVNHDVFLQLFGQEGLLPEGRFLEPDDVRMIFPDRLHAPFLAALPVVFSCVGGELDADVKRHHAGALAPGGGSWPAHDQSRRYGDN